MTHKDLINNVAGILGWSESDTASAINVFTETFIELISDGKSIDIEGFGVLDVVKKSEYILMNNDTGERFLMPPSVDVVFKSYLKEAHVTDSSIEESPLEIIFVPDELISKSVNSAFQNFEPTLLKEGVELEGVEVVIEGIAEPDEPDVIEVETEVEKEPVYDSEVKEKVEAVAEIAEQLHVPDIGPEPVVPFPKRSRAINKRGTSIFVPIMGGVIIAIASLFFFKGVSDEEN